MSTGPGPTHRGLLLLTAVLFAVPFTLANPSGAPGTPGAPSTARGAEALSGGPAVAALAITSFTAGPLWIRVNNTTYLNVTTSGGAPPLSYLYGDLPSGCASSNVSSLRCVPTVPGYYTVQVTVTDALGAVASATTKLQVAPPLGPPPVIRDFHVDPAEPTVGQVFWIFLNTSGGLQPLSYGFYQLPPPCPSFNEQNLSCLPGEPGIFRILLSVTDSAGRVNWTTTNITVRPAAGSGGTSPLGGGATVPVVVVGVALAAAVGAWWLRRRARGRPPLAG